MSDHVYKNIEALDPIKKVLNEADSALMNRERTIESSAIPDVLGGALGAGAGGAVSFGALYFGGVTGLSAAGITSGLATAGGVVGGGMAAGIGVLAAPVAIMGVAGYGIIASKKAKKLKIAKEKLQQEVILKQEAVIKELDKTNKENLERMAYLESLNIMLESALKDLTKDLQNKESLAIAKI